MEAAVCPREIHESAGLAWRYICRDAPAVVLGGSGQTHRKSFKKCGFKLAGGRGVK